MINWIQRNLPTFDLKIEYEKDHAVKESPSKPAVKLSPGERKLFDVVFKVIVLIIVMVLFWIMIDTWHDCGYFNDSLWERLQ